MMWYWVFWAAALGYFAWVCSLCYLSGKRRGRLEAADTLTLLRVRDQEATDYFSTTAHRICERLRHWARTGEIDDG